VKNRMLKLIDNLKRKASLARLDQHWLIKNFLPPSGSAKVVLHHFAFDVDNFGPTYVRASALLLRALLIKKLRF